MSNYRQDTVANIAEILTISASSQFEHYRLTELEAAQATFAAAAILLTNMYHKEDGNTQEAYIAGMVEIFKKQLVEAMYETHNA